MIYTIPDPDGLSPVERQGFIRLLKSRMGITDH